MISALLSMYQPSYSRILCYMLQNTEYQVGPYIAWYWRTNNFKYVMKRRVLHMTHRTKIVYAGLLAGIILQIITGIVVLVTGIEAHSTYRIYSGIGIILSYPIIWAHLIILPISMINLLVVRPKNAKLINASRKIFKDHSALKIAVAGSYGKTTIKEILLTVLASGKKVAATPANKNVAVSHAQFSSTLAGDEDILIVEFGEGAPGDVAKFARNIQPDIGIIAGLAPAHLDKYRTLEAAGKDIFSLAEFVSHKNMYVNSESKFTRPFIKEDFKLYDQNKVLGWKIDNIDVSVQGLAFMMTKGEQTLHLSSGLIGRHLVGSIAFSAALAESLGCTRAQIEEGVGRTRPFEHRMQPRALAGGWIIDDTYNGNLEGVRAGLALLSELSAKRKTYVTPGLVDQGAESEKIHVELGTLIARAKPDKVVLMKNSVTPWIMKGLKNGHYEGDIIAVEEPLKYYINIEHVMAAGDIVMMQNDWTDNYN